MTLTMTTAQVVETSVTVTNSSFQNYTHPDDHTTRTTDTPGFKPFTIIFIVKGKKEVKPLDYIDKYFKTRMVIIFDSIFLGKNSVSIQVKAHEVHIVPFGERKSLLEYKENDDDDDDDEENDDEENDDEVESEQEEDVVVESEQEEDVVVESEQEEED